MYIIYPIILDMSLRNIIFLDSRKYEIWDINTSNMQIINMIVDVTVIL